MEHHSFTLPQSRSANRCTSSPRVFHHEWQRLVVVIQGGPWNASASPKSHRLDLISSHEAKMVHRRKRRRRICCGHWLKLNVAVPEVVRLGNFLGPVGCQFKPP